MQQHQKNNIGSHFELSEGVQDHEKHGLLH